MQRLILQLVFKALQKDPRLLTFAVWHNLNRFIAKGASGGSFRVSPTLELIITAKTLVVQCWLPQPESVVLDRQLGEFSLWDGLFLEITEASLPLTFGQNPNVEYIDSEKLLPPLRIRTPQAGDVFLPINGQGHKKMSDYLIDAKVPVYCRPRQPILECGAGIVWLCGLRLDDRYRITETTKRIFKLVLRKK